MDLSAKCYELIKDLSSSELYGLTSQIRRASVSTAFNIAESYGRKTRAEYTQFLHTALGSLRELDTQLIIAQRVNLIKDQRLISLLSEVEEMQKILVATINKLKN